MADKKIRGIGKTPVYNHVWYQNQAKAILYLVKAQKFHNVCFGSGNGLLPEPMMTK